MTKMSNVPDDLVLEIFSRVPLTSLGKVRCTCKRWNALSEIQIFGKETAARKQVLGFMVLDHRVCSLRFDLQGILNEGDLVGPSVKQISTLDHIKMSEVFHADGLLLCVTEDNLMVWNPYLGQTKLIGRPEKFFDNNRIIAFGYDNNKNRNHKILRIWGDYDNTEDDFGIDANQCPVPLKGNTYFVAQEKITQDAVEHFLLCFDFTTESFGLPLPFHSEGHVVTLSCVREEKEQLAVLCKPYEELEIWITTKILPNAVSWSKFLKVEITPLNGFLDEFVYDFDYGSFFIDEEKKVAVVFYDYYEDDPSENNLLGAGIIGEDGHFKFLDLGEAWKKGFCEPFMFSSYVPSLVQLQLNQRGKRKAEDYSYPSKKKKKRTKEMIN
ncbi:unnamed protein product [Microthlaspi erraticum]|uniref:F-box domain-containing protein n=1 Tax=Microthlaspi erraticum TaxID=1685480 RepID=A0A6D2K1E8_9BRAS|nr:unnamed protein product [Microthlaspi erraticum]